MPVFKFIEINARSQNSLSWVQGDFGPARRRVGNGNRPSPRAPWAPRQAQQSLRGPPVCREPCLGAAVWQAPQRPQRPDADHVSPTLRGPEAPVMRNTDSVRCRETCTSLLPCFSSTLIFGISYPRKAVTAGSQGVCLWFLRDLFSEEVAPMDATPEWASLPTASAPPAQPVCWGLPGRTPPGRSWHLPSYCWHWTPFHVYWWFIFLFCDVPVWNFKDFLHTVYITF